MSAKTAALLRAAREKIAVPERWTKKELARHANGNCIGPNETNASCWCLVGALMSVNMGATDKAIQALGKIHDRNLFEFNDNPATTHADVLAALDKAILDEEQSA